MSAKKKQKTTGKRVEEEPQVSTEDVEVIYLKACAELKMFLEENNVGAAKRLSFFLVKLSESFQRTLDESTQKDISQAQALMIEWKSNLQINDTADFLSPLEQKWFAVKVMNIRHDSQEILLHYQGWDPKFDQWFPFTEDLVLLPPFSIIPKQKKKGDTAAAAKSAEIVPVTVTATSDNQEDTTTAAANEVQKVELEREGGEEATGSGRRVRRVVEVANNNSAAASATAVAKKASKEKAPKIEKDHNDWFCTNCGMLEAVNGTDLVLCDGLCRRSFHLECLSKAEHRNYSEQMAKTGTGNEEDAKYFCEHCRKAKHACFLCNKVGIDFLEVVRCSQAFCGKYYHLSCVTDEKGTFLRPTLSKPTKRILEGEEIAAFIEHHSHLLQTDRSDNATNVPSLSSPPKSTSHKTKGTPATATSAKTLSVSFPASNIRILCEENENTDNSASFKGQRIEIVDFQSFRCPRHFCDTCYEFHGHVDKTDLCHCHYCPRAFHSNCIPPSSRYNSVCMVCPLHPNALLPGDASLLQRSHTNHLSESSSTQHSSSSSAAKKSTTKAASSAFTAAEQEIAQHIVSFFEQLIIPDTCPDVQNILDNHYRLPLYVKQEVESIPPTFTMISKNNWELFPVEKMPPLIIPDSGCDCRDKCAPDTCFNYITRIECCPMKCRDKENPVLCKVGKKDCGNRAIQNRDYVKTKVFQEGSMGLGLKAEEFVPCGKLIIEYIGEIIDEDEMIRRMENQRILTPSDKEYYIMELYDGVYVDGKHQGNVSRYINHSCNPNCELQRWNVHGKIRIGIVAIRDIAPQEALSYDYQFDTQQADVFKCYCGSHNCRGTMAPKKDRRAQLEKLLLRSTSATIASSNGNSNNMSSVAALTANNFLSTLNAANSSHSNTVDGSGNTNDSVAASSNNAPVLLMTAARLESAEEKELRMQLVREAREKERNRSTEERRQEELSRSYVSKYQPGDALTEIKQGPIKSSFRFARQQRLFLVRNLRPNSQERADGNVRHLFLSRKEKWQRRVPDDWFEKHPPVTATASASNSHSSNSNNAAKNSGKRGRSSTSSSSAASAGTSANSPRKKARTATSTHVSNSNSGNSGPAKKRGRKPKPSAAEGTNMNEDDFEEGAEEDPFATSPPQSP